MIIIAALGRNGVIGRGDAMPWNVPDEYRQFLAFVEGQTVIMGRRSWEIFGADLTSAHNLVVSRRGGELPGAIVCPSVEEAIERARGFGKGVFSAGGASIYEQTLPLADTMYLSFIKGEFEGDTFFPGWDEAKWVVEQRTDHPAFEFVVYRRM